MVSPPHTGLILACLHQRGMTIMSCVQRLLRVRVIMSATAEQKLLDRMLNFDGHFSGYPGMTDTDEDLVFNAAEEVDAKDATIYLAMLASDHVKTRDQYEKARSFYDAFVATIWTCNMSEGSNEIWGGIQEEE
jgi:hypothetical protein